MFTLSTSCDVYTMEVHQHGSSILGYKNVCKIFHQISEAWEYAPVKLGKVCSSFVPNNITISLLYLLNGFQIIVFSLHDSAKNITRCRSLHVCLLFP